MLSYRPCRRSVSSLVGLIAFNFDESRAQSSSPHPGWSSKAKKWRRRNQSTKDGWSRVATREEVGELRHPPRSSLEPAAQKREER